VAIYKKTLSESDARVEIRVGCLRSAAPCSGSAPGRYAGLVRAILRLRGRSLRPAGLRYALGTQRRRSL